MSFIESDSEPYVRLLDEEPVKVEEVKVEEVKVEEVKIEEVKVEEVKETSINALLEKLSFHNQNNKLIPEEFAVLQKIISKTPTIIDEIEKSITEVIKNNTITIHDFPNFIVIVQILYERIHNLHLKKNNNEKCADLCAILLKFIVYILLEERKIDVLEENKTEFLSKLDNIIDSCIHLLKFPIVLQYENCCVIC